MAGTAAGGVRTVEQELLDEMLQQLRGVLDDRPSYGPPAPPLYGPAPPTHRDKVEWLVDQLTDEQAEVLYDVLDEASWMG